MNVHRENKSDMIPQIIHYFWFGNNDKPQIIIKCIDSWRKYHPDWEIREWNEKNYDVNKIPYIQEAYRQKKWAFVADYAKFDILNQYGGVSVDTDVEFLRPIPDELLEQEAFTGFENEVKINPGLIYASIAHQRVLEEILKDYEQREFVGTQITVCDIITHIMQAQGLISNNTQQKIGYVLVLPVEYFCCFDRETQHFTVTSNTVSIHHYTATWSPWYRKAHFGAIRILADILGPDRYLRIKHRLIKKRKQVRKI